MRPTKAEWVWTQCWRESDSNHRSRRERDGRREGKWRISTQLDSELQPLRVGVIEDRIGKTVGRITV